MMSKTSITPYLFFAGRCSEAIAFYRDRLGAVVEMVMRFDESPDPVPEGILQEGFERKVMHSSITIDGARFMLSDGCNDQTKFDGFQLALTVPTDAIAQERFHALADGGLVEMPLCRTFWSPCYGMVTDRFQVRWMVMVPGESP